MKNLFALFAGATPFLAQTPAPLAPDLPQHTKSILQTLIDAGPVMIPLFALSVFSVMLVIVYLLTIRRGAVVSSGYMATADALLRKRDYLGLLAVSNRHGEAIARVVQKMLDFTTKNPSADFQQVREIAETEGTRVATSLNNRVIYLADIGMIAPMLGLLGTVFGIIKSFGALGRRPGHGALCPALEWRQRGPRQHGGRPGHRHSGHDFLRLLPGTRAKNHFRAGGGRDACPGVAFVAVQQADGRARTPVLLEDEF